jgi:uncharacterized damage-inducible protein DinB
MVILHERHMREFFDTWQVAKSSGLALPKTDDPTYESLDTLARHVLHWAREYMIWICNMLELPGPEIPPTPDVDEVAEKTESYLEGLLAQWRSPLSAVAEDRFYRPQYIAPWKSKYCIDAMLEHAVMHPMRHRFQLLELMREGEGRITV